MVSWCPAGGKRVRKFFKTRTEADTEAEGMRLQQNTAGEVWLSLTAPQRAEIYAVWTEAEKRGVNLRAALDAYKPAKLIPKRAQAAYDDFIADRQREFLSRRTVAQLRSNVGRFVRTCAGRKMTALCHQDVTDWLEQFHPTSHPTSHPRTYNAYLTSLNTFFRWCIRKKFLSESPAASVLKINERRIADMDQEPHVLTGEQCKALLVATRATDAGLLPYVGLCLFAGLRPEREAAKLNWQDVGGEILVRGLNAKTRQRRHVVIHPALADLLGSPAGDACGPAAGDLPPRNLRRRFQAVRQAAGLLEGWKQDCMRHTFASMSLAAFGVEKTVAALGHGDYDMLFRHYRALVSPADAEKFWKLTA